jgi:hypothetical protein
MTYADHPKVVTQPAALMHNVHELMYKDVIFLMQVESATNLIYNNHKGYSSNYRTLGKSK